MKVHGKSVVVTGAGRGIGAAMALRFAREGARAIVVSDVDGEAARQVAASITELGVTASSCTADVGDKEQAHTLIAHAERICGQLDLVCSNAGIATGMGIHAPDEQWTKAWRVNVLAHVYLARATLPSMARRRTGHFVVTASAVGLLGLPGDAPYSVTKHAAVGLAEWLAVTYREYGVRVSALCPLGVRTELLMPGVRAGHPAALAVSDYAPIIEPEDVAESVVSGIAEERFLILPHPDVAKLYAEKAADLDAWLETAGRSR